jgi:diguanylate cyclase (GGDEF)-like protein/PAS domain S-box-containing protein
VTSQHDKFFWISLAYIGVVICSPSFFMMAVQFTKHTRWLTKGVRLILIGLGLLQLYLLWTDPWTGVFFGDVDLANPQAALSGGPGFWFVALFGYFITSLGVGLLIQEYYRARHLQREQVSILLISALLPFLSNSLGFLHLSPLPGLDIAPVVYSLSVVLFSYALFNYSMVDLAPMGREAVIEKMEESVLVIDLRERIVDLNPQARRFVDDGKNAAPGSSAREMFSTWLEQCSVDINLENTHFQAREKGNPENYYDVSITPLTHQDGEKAGRLIIWRDISAQKTVEEGFQKFFFAVEQSNASIIITDPNGRIEYVNPFFSRLTGYDLESVRGKTPNILKSGHTPDQVYKSLWQAINAGKEWGGEMLNKKRNGDLFWEYNRISPVTDRQGNITHFLAIKEDISERKRKDAELVDANELLKSQLGQIEALHAQLHEESIHDSLTGLFNRKFMEETLEREASNSARSGSPLSVVMIDVDRFKTVNDTYGHSAGDAVLKALGKFLRENTRSGDLACRYGGDEIAVVMPNASLDAAFQRAEEWRAAFMAMKFNFGNQYFSTSLSQGVASFPSQAANSLALLNAADKALYAAKEKRNTVCRYNPLSMPQFDTK